MEGRNWPYVFCLLNAANASLESPMAPPLVPQRVVVPARPQEGCSSDLAAAAMFIRIGWGGHRSNLKENFALVARNRYRKH